MEIHSKMLKFDETNFGYQYKSWQIENKISRTYTELINLESQLFFNRQLVTNYFLLLKNEFLRFEQGESSVFLLNQRESKLLESKLKQIEFQYKYHKAKTTLTLASGRWTM